MSDSTATPTTPDADSTEPTPELVDWSTDLTTDATDQALTLGAKIFGSLVKGDLAMHEVAKNAERVYRLYLKTDKARATLYFGETGPLGPVFETDPDTGKVFVARPSRAVAYSTAMGWVQAGRVLLTFGDDLKAINDRDPIGVKVLAMYDRFTVTPETTVAGREAIAREIVASAVEGRASFTNSPKSVASTIKAPTTLAEGEAAPTEAEAAATRESNRIGKIVTKLTDPFGQAFANYQVKLAGEIGMPIADLRSRGVGTFGLESFLEASKTGATWGSANGGTTPLALDRIGAVVDALAKTAAATALKEARAMEVAMAATSMIAPEPTPEPTITAVAQTRSSRGKATVIGKDGKPVAAAKPAARASKAPKASK